ncbi:MAG: hypothetical protein AB7P40_16490 [Chloroflexota bacterium]
MDAMVLDLSLLSFVIMLVSLMVLPERKTTTSIATEATPVSA